MDSHPIELTPIIISAVASGILSVLLERIPGFSTWWEPKSPSEKRQWVTVLMFLTALTIVTWNCAGDPLGFWNCVIGVNWKTTILVFIATLTNQPVHNLTKKENGSATT